MPIKKYLILTYYLVFLMILGLEILGTVYTFSQHINYGAQLASLQSKKQTLLSQKQDLEKTLSQKISLAYLESEKNNFKPIKQTIVVLPKTTMASIENP